MKSAKTFGAFVKFKLAVLFICFLKMWRFFYFFLILASGIKIRRFKPLNAK